MKPKNEPRIKQKDSRYKNRKTLDYDNRKTELKLFTWNVRSLNEPRALQRLAEILSTYKADITAIQEVRWLGRGIVDRRDYTFYYGGDTKDKMFGTGFLVTGVMRQHIIDFNVVDKRISTLRCRGKFFDTTIINCHAPTEERVMKKRSPSTTCFRGHTTSAQSTTSRSSLET